MVEFAADETEESKRKRMLGGFLKAASEKNITEDGWIGLARWVKFLGLVVVAAGFWKVFTRIGFGLLILLSVTPASDWISALILEVLAQ